MEHTGNKGEWSELYAFFKLLAEGDVHCADGNLKVDSHRHFPVEQAFRTDIESDPERVCYSVNRVRHCIDIAGKQKTLQLDQSVFAEQAEALLSAIEGLGKKENKSMPWLEGFLSEILCDSIKAKSKDKADIRLVLHNLATGESPELGYSIKSRLGSPSTLLNPNRDATNFAYRLHGVSEDVYQQCRSLTEGEGRKDLIGMMQVLNDSSLRHELLGVRGPTFHDNLTMLDMGMERVVGESLWLYYSRRVRTLSEAAAALEASDPLGIRSQSGQAMYAYKLKQLLVAAALGMTTGKAWDGKFNASGGYIVVREDGEVLCYHFFDRNDLEEYLFRNTQFDTPSTTRHGFGTLTPTGQAGVYELLLNLQIRFT